uniref:transposase domain-containing protein n=1 Tax=Acetatifactor sp. TaxID=1872090 RepID=UPI0040567A32
MYSLVETAKANNQKIYEYLKYLLTEIPKFMDSTVMDFLEDLLSWSEQLPKVCRKRI